MKSKGKACCFLPSSVCRMKSGTFGNICGKFCKPPLKNNFMTVTYIMQEYIIDSQHYFSLILKYKSSCWKFYKLIKYFISLYRKEWGTCWWKREIENPLAFYMPPNDLCQCCLKKKSCYSGRSYWFCFQSQLLWRVRACVRVFISTS